MDYSKLAKKLRSKIEHFSGELSASLGKVPQRLVTEMMYGIMASESVLLTEIARTLEESIPIKKTEWRLSRNLPHSRLAQVLQRNILLQGAERIGNDTLLIIDPSDITKKYAKKMEHLARVRDGSEKILANGYWTLHVVGTELEGKELIPLYQRLYSQEASDFISENDEILWAIKMVSEAVQKRGLWIMDRGGDRIKLFKTMLSMNVRFLFRLKGDRNLVFNRSEALASDIAHECPCPYSESIVKVEQDKEVHCTISYGYRVVRLPGIDRPLSMLVVKGFSSSPLMLLTTEPLRRSRKVLWKYVRAFLRRWSIEETIRFVKQSYDLENVRVLSYRGLQNLMVIVLAVFYFTAVVLDRKQKLRIMVGHILKAAKRVFGIPDFKYYALADGMSNIFTRAPGCLQVSEKPNTDQLWLSPFACG